MEYGDRYNIERSLKDTIYELRALRNSAQFLKHFPEAGIKAREAELFFKGILLEVKEMEIEDD
jgi:hypothetical protein